MRNIGWSKRYATGFSKSLNSRSLFKDKVEAKANRVDYGDLTYQWIVVLSKNSKKEGMGR